MAAAVVWQSRATGRVCFPGPLQHFFLLDADAQPVDADRRDRFVS
jgi:hypothetical protein